MRHDSLTIQKFLRDQSQSGLTIAAFCRDRELKVATFYTWKRKYALAVTAAAAAAAAAADRPGFCKLLPRAGGSAMTTSRQLHFPSGLRLCIEGLSTGELAELILKIERAHA